jgi:uncharacterized protein YhaN
MRFDFLNLKAFGHFTDYELLFDQAKNFHLIYGPNEAGKSTTLRSITHFLYGFPGQTKDSFLHNNTKLRIEGQLQNSKGESLQFARRKGNKNTVLDSNDQPLNEELVNSFLNGINENHFLNMFALNHESLREGGESLLQSGGNLGESIFSAASGITLLGKVYEDLEKKSGDIYKKSAKNPKLNKLMREEKELLKQISEYQLKIQAWKELETKYKEGQKEIEDLIKLVKTLRSEQEKLQRIKFTLPKIARLRDLASKLTELGEVPVLAENAVVLRKEAEQKLELSRKEKKRSEDDYSLLEKELMGISIPNGLIDQETLIDVLYREVQTYQNQVKRLPSLEGERKQLEDRVMAFLKEMDFSQADIEKIDVYRLTASQKETIKELCKQKPLLDQAADGNKRERHAIMEELDLKEAEFASLKELPDIEELEVTINMIRGAGQIEESLATLLREMKQKEALIQEEIKRLPQWDGTYQELMELTVPGLNETVKKFEQDRALLLQKLQKVMEHIQTQFEAIESHEGRIRDLESLSEIPSEDKLLKVRSKREEGWHLIRKKLHQGSVEGQLDAYTEGRALETVYEEQVRDADQIADKMRLEAAKVGEKNKLLSDIDNCKKKITELQTEELRLKEEFGMWERAWLELWKPSAIIPLTPEEMREWLDKYSQIRLFVQEYEKLQETIKDLEAKKKEFKQALITALSQIVSITEDKSLVELLSLAEKHQKKIREDLFQRQSLEASINEIKRRLHSMTNKQIEIELGISKWKEDWIQAIQGTNISENTPPIVAESLLSKYENGIQTFEEMKRIEKEQETIQSQIGFFEERVQNVISILPLHLDELSVDIAVTRLYAVLQKAKQDKVTVMNLNNQLKKLQMMMKHATEQSEEAERTLSKLMEQAQCNTIEELEIIERIFALKKDYEANIQTTETELLQIGNGRTLQELIVEADSIEQDSLEVELDEIKRELEEIEPRRSKLEQEHGVVKKEFEEKIQGSNTASVLAEQTKESLLAQMENLADQYIQLKLASTLLQKGIEHYRNQNQDPILKRASELFARLTLQSFAGLMVDYDDKDQPVLMGVRENGDKVAIDGMSDGTTDQLYLALRVASIEKYAGENEPIPFIVDDILVHFDDKRSKETLKILLEISKQTQIIFFTHHARLVEIMSEIALDMEYQLIELNSNQTVLV